MPLWFVFILIFVLYLVDKHNKWAQARTVLVYAVSLCVIAAVLFLAYGFYTEYQFKQKQKLEAATLKQACLAWQAQFQVDLSSAEAAPVGCEGPLEDFAINNQVHYSDLPKGATIVSPDQYMWPYAATEMLSVPDVKASGYKTVAECADSLVRQYCSKQSNARCPTEGTTFRFSPEFKTTIPKGVRQTLAIYKRAETFCMQKGVN